MNDPAAVTTTLEQKIADLDPACCRMDYGIQRRGIYIVPPAKEDLQWVARSFENKSIADSFGFYKENAQEVFLNRYNNRDLIVAIIRRVADRQRTGFVIMYPPVMEEWWEFGYVIPDPKHRNAFDALNTTDAMAHYLFDHLNVVGIGWRQEAINTSAISIVKRIGYEVKEQRLIDDRPYNFYAYRRDRWEQRVQKLKRAEEKNPSGLPGLFVTLFPPYEPLQFTEMARKPATETSKAGESSSEFQPVQLLPETPVEVPQEITKVFDLFDPQLRTDPYSIYHYFSTHDPVHYIPPSTIPGTVGVCLLFKHADVAQYLKDKRIGREWWRFVTETKEQFEAQRNPFANYVNMVNNWMLLRDAPDHTRLRGLFNRFLTPAIVEGLESHVQEMADKLLDDAPETGEMEVIGQYFFPLGLMVIAQLMGLRDLKVEQFRVWATTVVRALDAVPTTEIYEGADRAVAEIQQYIAGVMAEKRRAPGGDIVTKMLNAVDEKLLSEQEAIDNCIMFLFAGFETTVSLLGTGLYRLLTHPEQLEMLKQDPSLIDTTIDEFLRYDPSVQAVDRLAYSDFEIAGKKIQRRDRIFFVLGAANRDPELYPDPHRFDITRRGTRHLSFGIGMHGCIGARLAYSESRIAINTLLKRTRHLELKTPDVKWRANWLFRALESLPVRFEIER